MSVPDMSPFAGGDIPMDENNEGQMSAVPNLIINADLDVNGDAWSDDDDQAGDDEADMESGEYAGYQLLSHDLNDETEDITTDENNIPSSSAEGTVEPTSRIAGLLPSKTLSPDPATHVSYRDSPEEQESRKQAMAEDEQIKQAMVGFHLPSSAVPQWASVICEEDWKQTLAANMKDDTKSNGRSSAEKEGLNPKR